MVVLSYKRRKDDDPNRYGHGADSTGHAYAQNQSRSPLPSLVWPSIGKGDPLWSLISITSSLFSICDERSYTVSQGGVSQAEDDGVDDCKDNDS